LGSSRRSVREPRGSAERRSSTLRDKEDCESEAGDAVVTFDAAGRWSGSDGCNRLGGTYQVDPSGAFKGTLDGVHTLIGCANVPNDDVMRTATRATGGDAELTFQSSDGRDLARYVRVRAASGL
jgi:hypothetical protein